MHEKYSAAADMKGFQVCIRVDVVNDHVRALRLKVKGQGFGVWG